MWGLGQDVRPTGLAIGRILIALASFGLIFEWWVTLARISSGGFLAIPVVGWAPTVTPELVQALVISALISAVMLLLGLLARPAAGIVCATSCVALLLDQQTYSNHLYLLVWMTGLLALSRCGDAWSLPQKRAVNAIPYWPIFLLKLQISVVYFWTGLSKLNEQYLSGEVLQTYMQGWVPVPENAFGLIAALSIVVELFLAFALWVPRLLRMACVLGAGLHLGIVVLLQDPFPLVLFAMLMAAGYVQFWTSRPKQRFSSVSELVQTNAVSAERHV